MTTEFPSSDARRDALAAYARFFEGFNSRDPAHWADALNFPHVRISGRAPVSLTATRAAHEQAMSWAKAVDSGWDRSVGAVPEILHVTPDVVFIAGGWTRYDKAGKAILSNQVSYVITRMEIEGVTHWGMQARFGIDAGNAANAGTQEAMQIDQALQTVAAFLEAWVTQSPERAAGLVNIPAVQVSPGLVQRFDEASALEAHLRTVQMPDLGSPRLRAIQASATAVNVLAGGAADGSRRALFQVILRPTGWRIQGIAIA